eukprot:2226592-Amphidinium_carterae.1
MATTIPVPVDSEDEIPIPSTTAMGSHTDSVGGNTVEPRVPVDEIENANMQEILEAVNTVDQVLHNLVDVVNTTSPQPDPPTVEDTGATEVAYFFPPEGAGMQVEDDTLQPL